MKIFHTLFILFVSTSNIFANNDTDLIKIENKSKFAIKTSVGEKNDSYFRWGKFKHNTEVSTKDIKGSPNYYNSVEHSCDLSKPQYLVHCQINKEESIDYEQPSVVSYLTNDTVFFQMTAYGAASLFGPKLITRLFTKYPEFRNAINFVLNKHKQIFLDVKLENEDLQSAILNLFLEFISEINELKSAGVDLPYFVRSMKSNINRNEELKRFIYDSDFKNIIADFDFKYISDKSMSYILTGAFLVYLSYDIAEKTGSIDWLSKWLGDEESAKLIIGVLGCGMGASSLKAAPVLMQLAIANPVGYACAKSAKIGVTSYSYYKDYQKKYGSEREVIIDKENYSNDTRIVLIPNENQKSFQIILKNYKNDPEFLTSSKIDSIDSKYDFDSKYSRQHALDSDLKKIPQYSHEDQIIINKLNDDRYKTIDSKEKVLDLLKIFSYYDDFNVTDAEGKCKLFVKKFHTDKQGNYPLIFAQSINSARDYIIVHGNFQIN